MPVKASLLALAPLPEGSTDRPEEERAPASIERPPDEKQAPAAAAPAAARAAKECLASAMKRSAKAALRAKKRSAAAAARQNKRPAAASATPSNSDTEMFEPAAAEHERFPFQAGYRIYVARTVPSGKYIPRNANSNGANHVTKGLYFVKEQTILDVSTNSVDFERRSLLRRRFICRESCPSRLARPRIARC